MLPALRLPCHESTRSWLLRVGLFLLRRPLPQVGQWALIVDATIRLGTRKCLVILAVRLDQRPRRALAHGDVLVADLVVTAQCTGALVEQRLDGVRQRLGTVVQVVADQGSDLKKGIRLLQAKQPTLVSTYDVTHQLACLVEKELEGDRRWREFLGGCSSSLSRLKQTAGAFLMPPTLRRQARYMNVDTHIEWGRRVLGVLDRQDVGILAKDLGVSREEASAWLEERLGWLRGFRAEVEKYGRMMAVVKEVQEEVKEHGLSRQSPQRVEGRLPASARADARLAAFLSAVRDYLKREAEQVPAGQVWLGSSDVIESLFGKYKYLNDQAPFPEMAANVLLLPLLTTPLSGPLIRDALQAVHAADVQQWIDHNIGLSTFAKIKRVLVPPEKAASRRPRPDTLSA